MRCLLLLLLCSLLLAVHSAQKKTTCKTVKGARGTDIFKNALSSIQKPRVIPALPAQSKPSFTAPEGKTMIQLGNGKRGRGIFIFGTASPKVLPTLGGKGVLVAETTTSNPQNDIGRNSPVNPPLPSEPALPVDVETTPSDGGASGSSTTARPTTPGGPDKCGSIALFPTKDRCWKVFDNVTESKQLCDATYGVLKKKVVPNRFTGAECGCNDVARGDGYNCYGECTRPQATKLGKCPNDWECNMDFVKNEPFCNCIFGMAKDKAGVCKPVESACKTCKHNCHQASSCMNVPLKNQDQEALYQCAPCDHALGFAGESGVSCRNIDECAAAAGGDSLCDAQAQCADRDPIYDNGMKYECVCKKGYTKKKDAGTKCDPCVDNNECEEQPGICGENAECENHPGDFRCICLKGFEKDLDNKCGDINECLHPGACHQFANCTNTIGSYNCTCNEGFMKAIEGGKEVCVPDPAFFCKDCDKNTTECKLTPSRHAYSCECKMFHSRVDPRSCKPITYCDKAEKNDCAPPEQAICKDRPDGSGFDCTCKEPEYEGDGRNCTATNICMRKNRCLKISNTRCVADKDKPREKYECVCHDGFVRQLADQDKPDAPCYATDSNVVNNCTLCDKNMEDCKKVEGDKSGALRSCVCKPGYVMGPSGRCADKNECARPDANNCDPQCSVCINKIPHIDGAPFVCEIRKGWKNTSGTTGTCEDDVECDHPTPVCTGANRECMNTIGSFKCKCKLGFMRIPGVKDCPDDDECARGNFTCNDFSVCKNTIGSYECVCAEGYKEVKRDETGRPVCVDINECTEGVNATGTAACPKKTRCENSLGSFQCPCLPGYRKDQLGHCIDIHECFERLDNCDVLTTSCLNTEGGFLCPCKHGYMPEPAKSNNTCFNIDECTSKTHPHSCNGNSTCHDYPGSYKCVCDADYEPEPGTLSIRPYCTRIDVCKTKKDLNCMCLCKSTDAAPYYKCDCQPGSINFNATSCITPGFCDTEKNPAAPEFPCPAHSVCKNERCLCERNYEWINVDEPLTVEKIKARKGCRPESWCKKYTCAPPSKCVDLGPGVGECRCPGGYKPCDDGQCCDINECANATNPCPAHSTCHNMPGAYTCECDHGYTDMSTDTDQDKRFKEPKCEAIHYCALRQHNCSKYPNTVCRDTNPLYECDCKPGYQRNQTKAHCPKATQCGPMPCSDINECKAEKPPCHADATCTNNPGSFKCICNKGFVGTGFECTDYDECKQFKDTCDRTTQDCVNQPGSFNCTCKRGYELNKYGNCSDINECLKSDPKINECLKDTETLQCVNTPGSYFCDCAPGYVKAINGSCIDDNECNARPSPCPGRPNHCTNTPGDFTCACQKGYKYDDSCDGQKNCTCVDINECDEFPCGANTLCENHEGFFKCKCKSGYEGDAYKNCTFIELCEKFPCDPVSQRCDVIGGAPKCSCKTNYTAVADGKCIQNPCLDGKNGGCGQSAMCKPTKDGKTACSCATGFILDDANNCVPEDVCKCGDKQQPCRSEVCDDRELAKCYVQGARGRCFCDEGYKFNAEKKKCEDINECVEKAPCPSLANCTNTIGSYSCVCPRGQKFVGGECVVDTGCSLENYCRDDPNSECVTSEDKTRAFCECAKHYQGTGRPADALCTSVDACEAKKAREGKAPCTGEHEYAVSVDNECQCVCHPAYKRNSSLPHNCYDRNECEENLFVCNATFECHNTEGGYTCVCPKFHKLVGDRCVRDNKCEPNPCDNATQHCNWRTGECTCKDEFVPAANGTCGDFDECTNMRFNCPDKTTRCNNTWGGYECICIDGYVSVGPGPQCIDINECEAVNPCGERIHTCKNLPGTYQCICAPGWIQISQFECAANRSDSCTGCSARGHCFGSSKRVINCTCNEGYQGDGIMCEDIDECATGTHKCHANATCTNESPLYSCKCNEPLVGDGRNMCNLPDMCTTKYNDCPKESVCHGLQAKSAEGAWVTCVCDNKGLEFNNKTRQCEDIDECKRCKEYENCPCPKEAKCRNTEGSFTCACPEGYVYNPATNKCDDIDECVTGAFQEKCVAGRGTCVNKPGSWECKCAPGYKSKEGDNQICDRDIFCGIKDQCDKNTTTCHDENVGYRCPCLSGLLRVPGSDTKCEDKNECKDGSHNCALDGSELCTNTYRSFACNCSNGYTRDEATKKCQPDNKCSPAEAEKANCGAYSICVNLPGKDGKTAPKCICETGYYLAEKEQVCVVVPPCKQDFDCPSNSKCQVVQAQNATGETGTYKCICAEGYEMIGHQCFPMKPCKAEKICGEGVCIDKLLPPFYECTCTPGTRQDNGTAPCTPLTCEGSNVCTPNAVCKTRESGGIYCQCKEGFSGLGVISSPCKPDDVCATATPCSRFATCHPKGAEYSCVCNAGYSGNGTWCTNINECADPALNNCDENALCTDTQGGYKCTCKEGYTGVGTKGQCHNINECQSPALNKCDVLSTNCNDTVPGYECPCKTGYVRNATGGSPFACDDDNECLKKETCGIHTCQNLPGSYECICKIGYESVEGSERKLCKDKDECKLTPPVCHRYAKCDNNEGSYTCTCNDQYVGDGVLNCTVIDVCVPGKNTCDTKSTKCRQLGELPKYQCDCLAGFVPGQSPDACNDVDECTDEQTPYDRESVKCINLPGTYQLECKELYEVKHISADKKNITCVPKDECAADAAYAETMAKIAAGENKGDWKTWMVAPKDNSTGYAICYYNALTNVSFNTISPPSVPLANRMLPFCVDLSPKVVSNQTQYDARLRGFECGCAPPVTISSIKLGARIGYTCPNPHCPDCRTELNYECKNLTCSCMHGYSQRNINNLTQCIKRECGNGEPWPEAIIKKDLVLLVRCENDRIVLAVSGYEIIRDTTTNIVIDVVDINECALDPAKCCSATANCTGASCVKCFNTPGSYSCRSDTIVCETETVDKNTCKCPEMPCTRTTSWYMSCAGSAKAVGGAGKRVCSRIQDNSVSKYMSFESEQALLEFAMRANPEPYGDADCGFAAKQPANFYDNPAVNYYGPCLDNVDAVVCPEGAKAKATDFGPACPIRVKLEDLPTIKTGHLVGHQKPSDPPICSAMFGTGTLSFLPENKMISLMG